MDTHKAKSTLNKINRLFGSIEEEQLSAIERDLMLSYIRDLYDACLTTDTQEVAHKPTPQPKQPVVVETPKAPAPEAKKTKIVYNDPPAPVVQPVTPPPVVVETPPPPPPVVQTPPPPPPVIQTPPPPPPVIQTPPPPPPPPPVVETPVAPPPPPATPKTKYKVAVENPFTVDEFLELFEKTKPSGDRYSKLSSTPVTDLKAAISLNDKLLFINELFKGNAASFETCVQQINAQSTLDGVKDLLTTHYIEPFEWLAEDEDGDRGIAVKAFVKLIQRRFS